MTTTMVQMNTRIDADLKRRGDEALKRAGFTPSQAIRALWEYAADKAYEEGLALAKRFAEKTGVPLNFDYEMDEQEMLEQALYERFIEGKRAYEV